MVMPINPQSTHKKIVLVLILLLVSVVGIALLLKMVLVYGFHDRLVPPIQPPVACTLEAKICPDGSAVGRSGPNCEFAPCPISDVSQAFNQKYQDPAGQFQFSFPNGFNAVIIPPGRDYVTLGIFQNLMDGETCARTSYYSADGKGCERAYYYLSFRTFDLDFWKSEQQRLINEEIYHDAQERVWVVSSIEANGRMIFNGYLVGDNEVKHIYFWSHLSFKTYPGFLDEARGLAFKTFDTFE